MTSQAGGALEQPEWRLERFRYRVLRSVYDYAGASSRRMVAGSQIRAELETDPDELFRVFDSLEDDGLLISGGDHRQICITDFGVDYIERIAGRRRSIRAPIIYPGRA
jgi:hypothetical protein